MTSIPRLCIAACMATSLTVVLPILGQSTAGAVCHNAAGFSVTSNGGYETIGSPTPCDGLNNAGQDYYDGLYRKNSSDGNCRYVAYFADSTWQNTSSSCDSFTYQSYAFSDADSNAPIKICVSGGSCGSQWNNFGF